MRTKNSRHYLILLCCILLITGAGILLGYLHTEPKPNPQNQIEPASVTPAETSTYHSSSTIGYSVQNRPIVMHEFGAGSSTLLFVGGVHGGYEWNSVVLAEKFIEYFGVTENAPNNVKIVIIPNLNPDGTTLVTGTDGILPPTIATPTATNRQARFNANGVDLNRNFDCKWQSKSKWQGMDVSAGTAPFSEPEARALRTAVATLNPTAVVFWHSQANAVYASECNYGILPSTLTLMNSYAEAAGYQAIASFDAYPVTGDAEGWLASINIPAITVELSSHESLDWDKNLLGVKAVLTNLEQ